MSMTKLCLLEFSDFTIFFSSPPVNFLFNSSPPPPPPPDVFERNEIDMMKDDEKLVFFFVLFCFVFVSFFLARGIIFLYCCIFAFLSHNLKYVKAIIKVMLLQNSSKVLSERNTPYYDSNEERHPFSM